MIFEQWSVVAVPFPFLERPALKKRPAIVLSSEPFNRMNLHSILVMVTTAKHSAWPSDHLIHDLVAAGLPVPSMVRWKVFTLPNDTIEKQIGLLGERDQAAMRIATKAIVD